MLISASRQTYKKKEGHRCTNSEPPCSIRFSASDMLARIWAPHNKWFHLNQRHCLYVQPCIISSENRCSPVGIPTIQGSQRHPSENKSASHSEPLWSLCGQQLNSCSHSVNEPRESLKGTIEHAVSEFLGVTPSFPACRTSRQSPEYCIQWKPLC